MECEPLTLKRIQARLVVLTNYVFRCLEDGE